MFKKNRDFARRLRRNMTDAESHLWQSLRNRQLLNCKFRRQQPIGRYIVDFVCFEKNLVIELDGGQHADQIKYDSERTRWLQKEGFQVLRFWNNLMFQEFDGVIEVILKALEGEAPAL